MNKALAFVKRGPISPDVANRESIKMLSETRVSHFTLVTICEVLISLHENSQIYPRVWRKNIKDYFIFFDLFHPVVYKTILKWKQDTVNTTKFFIQINIT
jgi:hypothetical protein